MSGEKKERYIFKIEHGLLQKGNSLVTFKFGHLFIYFCVLELFPARFEATLGSLLRDHPFSGEPYMMPGIYLGHGGHMPEPLY